MKQNVKIVPREKLYKKSVFIKTFFFWLVWGIVKYFPSPIGDFARFSVLKIFANKIKSWRIKEGVFVVFPENISIGCNTGISEYSHLDGYGGISIGNNCMIGHHVTLLTRDHQIDKTSGPMRHAGMMVGDITIGEDVYIGAKAFINKGVKIGDGAVVGAGSVVTKDVEPFSIVCGNPARFIRYRQK